MMNNDVLEIRGQMNWGDDVTLLHSVKELELGLGNRQYQWLRESR